MKDILSPLPHVSNVRFRLAIKKYFYKDIEPEYTQLIKDLIVGDAAETLDTLKELADALDNDSDFYATVTTRFNELQLTVEDNELVTSTALNDLNTRTSTIEEKIPEIDEALQGKADTNSLATVATSGSYNDLSNKPTIPTVPTNVSEFNNDAGYLTSHQDISRKEDKVDTVSASGTTLTAEVGKYYTLSNVGTLAITLPTIPTGTTHVQMVMFYISTGSAPAVTFTSMQPVYYADDFEIDVNSTYEVNALWNGTAWVVANVTIIIE